MSKVTQDLTGQTPYFIFNPAMNRTFASKGRSPWRSSVKNVIYRSNLVTVFSCSLSEQDDVTEVLFRKKDTKFVLDHFSGILSFLVYVKVQIKYSADGVWKIAQLYTKYIPPILPWYLSLKNHEQLRKTEKKTLFHSEVNNNQTCIRRTFSGPACVHLIHGVR